MQRSIKILNSERILLPIPPAVKNEARKAANEQGLTLSAYLRDLIVTDLSGRNHNISITTKIL